MDKTMGKFLVKDTSLMGSNPETEKGNVTNDDQQFPLDVPQDIIFPDQLNRYFRDQIHSLTLENGSLRRSLEEIQEELTTTKEKLMKAEQPAPMGRVAEMADYKIAQLSKRLREQTAEMESLRTQTKEAVAKLRRLEDRELAAEIPPEPASSSELAEKDKQIKTLTEKLQTSNAKMCDFRNQYQAMKQEMKLAQKVIESEVGDKCSIQELAKENGTWRGRAQQILTLQSKVQQLQEQLSNTNPSESPASIVLRQMEKDRRANYEETFKQLNQKTMQVEDLKKKLDAARARNKVLENEMIQMKTKANALAEKGSRDEQLLSTLTLQINAFEDRGKAQMQCFSKLQGSLNKQQQELELEKTKNEQLQKALADRESRIRRMEEQIAELRRNGISAYEGRRIGAEMMEKATDTSRVEDEIRSNVADAERMKLIELLNLLNGKLEETRTEKAESESQLRRERCKNVKLETKIARLELEKVGALKTGRGSYSQASSKSSEPSMNEADILAQQQIEYLQEECLALKTRIETLQMEKEACIKAFISMEDARSGVADSHGDGKMMKKDPVPAAERYPTENFTRKNKLSRRKIRGPPANTVASNISLRQASFSSEDLKYY